MIIRYKCNDFHIEIKEIVVRECDDGNFSTMVQYVLKNWRGIYNRNISYVGRRFPAIKDILYDIVITEKER